MINSEDTAIICIDLQEKLVNMPHNNPEIINNTLKVLKTASILNINTIITEQYPKGLGQTIEEIKNIHDFKIMEKTTFSIVKTDEINKEIKKLKVKNIILFGIETHICVLQSTLDLIQKGYNVFLLKDCCASRNEDNHLTALNLMENYGAKICTVEIVLFNLLKSSKHPNFKEIQALIK